MVVWKNAQYTVYIQDTKYTLAMFIHYLGEGRAEDSKAAASKVISRFCFGAYHARGIYYAIFVYSFKILEDLADSSRLLTSVNPCNNKNYYTNIVPNKSDRKNI